MSSHCSIKFKGRRWEEPTNELTSSCCEMIPADILDDFESFTLSEKTFSTSGPHWVLKLLA